MNHKLSATVGKGLCEAVCHRMKRRPGRAGKVYAGVQALGRLTTIPLPMAPVAE